MTDIPPLISADAGILVGSNDLVRQVAAVAGKMRVTCAMWTGGRILGICCILVGSSVAAVAGAC